MGDPIPQAELTAFLDRINRESGLPHTILYTLNPAAYPALATAAGCFPQVYVGAAWWFNDHKSGIEEQLRICAQNAHLAVFPGMLTDSRSFFPMRGTIISAVFSAICWANGSKRENFRMAPPRRSLSAACALKTAGN